MQLLSHCPDLHAVASVGKRVDADGPIEGGRGENRRQLRSSPQTSPTQRAAASRAREASHPRHQMAGMAKPHHD